jgi:uncharacterized MAPEG superfamily protein
MPTFANNTETAIIGLVLWALLLLSALASYRSFLTVIRGRAANSYAPTGLDLQPFGLRLTRAHANAYEFLPFALVILVFAVASGQTRITDDLAIVLVGLRIAQSLVHIVSTSAIAVIIRFLVFFIPQIGIVMWWSLKLIAAGSVPA